MLLCQVGYAPLEVVEGVMEDRTIGLFGIILDLVWLCVPGFKEGI